MQAVILKCRPNARFHAGETDLESCSSVIHADTLFSAIVNTMTIMYDVSEVEEFVETVRKGELTFSSVFYCLERNDAYHWLLPKPITSEATASGDYKMQKKIEFVSKEWLEYDFISLDYQLGGIYAFTQKELQEEFKLKPGSPKVPVKKNTIPHTAVRLEAFRDNFFQVNHFSVLHHSQYQTHLYFLWKTTLPDNDSVIERFKTTLRLLADEGIGGERSSGMGFFDSVAFVSDWNISPRNQEKNRYLMLSTFIPDSAEEFAKTDSYRLLLRGGNAIGKDGDPQWARKQVRVIAEGAIVTDGNLQGRLADIAPEKGNATPILRYGKAFCIPF